MQIIRNDYAIPNVAAMRFADPSSLVRIARACQFTEVVYGQDERGHFIASFDAPQWFWDLPREIKYAAPAAVRAPRDSAPRGGVTREIYEACLANSSWDVQAALYHFQHYNPSTVRVQYGKARAAR